MSNRTMNLLIDVDKVSPFTCQPVGNCILGEVRDVPNGGKIVLPTGQTHPDNYIHILAVGPDVKDYKPGDMVHASLAPHPELISMAFSHAGVHRYLFKPECIMARLVE